MTDLDTLKSYGDLRRALAGHLHVLHELLRRRGGEARAGQCRDLMVQLAEDRFTLAVIGQFIAGTIRDRTETEAVRLFALSCRRALAARRHGDVDLHARSGLGPLEEALLLSEEKTTTFLVSVADKVLRLLAAESDEENLYRRAGELPEPVVRQRLDALQNRLREQAAARDALFLRLRRHVVEQAQAAVDPAVQSLIITERSRVELRVGRALGHLSWRPWTMVVRHLTERELRRLDRRVGRWLGSHLGDPTFSIDDFCRQCWQNIDANLEETPALAATAFGLEFPNRRDFGTAPSWQGVKLGRERLVDFTPRPDVRGPFWLHLLPARLGPRALCRRVVDEHARLCESLRAQILARVENRVSAAIDRAQVEARERGEAIQARILAGISGQRESSADPEMQQLQEELGSLRAEVVRTWQPTQSAQGPPTPSAPRAVEISSRAPALDAQPELARVVQTRGCPICDELGRVAFDFLRHWQYALFADADAPRQFADEVGFCPLHMWHLEALSSQVGLAAGCAELVACLSRTLTQGAGDAGRSSRMVEGIRRSAYACRVCGLLRERERWSVERLVAFLAEARGRELYRRGQGVCLRHLALLAAASDDETARFVVGEAGRRFDEIGEDMRAFALKTTALRRRLLNADEEDAHWRAITHIAGAKALAVAWREDAEV